MGLETLVLAVSRSRPPPRFIAELPKLLKQQSIPSPESLRKYLKSKFPGRRRPTRGYTVDEISPDPIRGSHEALEGKLRDHFEAVVVLSFLNGGVK